MKFRLLTAVFSVALSGGEAAGAPVNDHFVNATPLAGLAALVSGTNTDATKEVGEPNHGGNPGGKSVWWTWTAPASGSVTVETTGSSFDTLLAAYTGASSATLQSLASNDDTGGRKTSSIAFNVRAETPYRIAVDGFGGASGEIQLSLKFRDGSIEKPWNDDFANRTDIGGAFGSARAETFRASKEPGEPKHADELGGASVWWNWTAPSTGNVSIGTQGSSFDTLLAVYTGSVLTNLTLIAKNDDISPHQPASSVTFHALAGTAYAIAVDGFAGEGGEVQLRLAMDDNFRLAAPRRQPNGMWQIRLSSAPGQTLAIEASMNLTNWVQLGAVTNTSGTAEFTDPDPGNRQRFYRAQRRPTD